MFRFGNPEAFQLIWVLVGILIISIVMERRARRRTQAVLGAKNAPLLLASFSPGRRRLKTGLQILSLLFFTIALARPQMGKSQQQIKSEGIELMVLADVSNSMLAEDVKPSRLMHMKKEIMRLLEKMPSDKVGLIAFAGSAVLLSPLTPDKSALRMFLDSMNPETVATQGTDFKKALQEAYDAFKRGGTDPEEDDSVRVTRVILIASDGEDNEPGAVEAARQLASEGVRIFSLAFGTEQGGPIPIRDERGYLRGYKKDRGNQQVVSATKGTVLRSLAKEGKGSFYHAGYSGSEVRSLKSDFDKLEKAEFDSQLSTNYDERYQLPLAIGLILALAALWLGERRPEGRIWKGRFEVAGR